MVEREADRRTAAGDPELAVDAREVGVDGARAEGEAFGDLRFDNPVASSRKTSASLGVNPAGRTLGAALVVPGRRASSWAIRSRVSVAFMERQRARAASTSARASVAVPA